MEKNLSEANTTNELVVLNANGTTFDSTTRIAVIIVDGNENDWEVQLHSIVQKLKDHHIFVIAVFIANRYNWTFDKSIMFNIDSWIVAQSKGSNRIGRIPKAYRQQPRTYKYGCQRHQDYTDWQQTRMVYNRC